MNLLKDSMKNLAHSASTPATAFCTPVLPAVLAALAFSISMHAVAQTPDPAVPPPAVPASAPAPIVSAPAQRYAANDVKRVFSYMDSNHDSQLSRAEASGFKNVAKHFDAADTNRDGMPSQSEFDAALNSPRVQ